VSAGAKDVLLSLDGDGRVVASHRAGGKLSSGSLRAAAGIAGVMRTDRVGGGREQQRG
jgi:hypothetical protein